MVIDEAHAARTTQESSGALQTELSLQQRINEERIRLGELVVDCAMRVFSRSLSTSAAPSADGGAGAEFPMESDKRISEMVTTIQQTFWQGISRCLLPVEALGPLREGTGPRHDAREESENPLDSGQTGRETDSDFRSDAYVSDHDLHIKLLRGSLPPGPCHARRVLGSLPARQANARLFASSLPPRSWNAARNSFPNSLNATPGTSDPNTPHGTTSEFSYDTYDSEETGHANGPVRSFASSITLSSSCSANLDDGSADRSGNDSSSSGSDDAGSGGTTRSNDVQGRTLAEAVEGEQEGWSQVEFPYLCPDDEKALEGRSNVQGVTLNMEVVGADGAMLVPGKSLNIGLAMDSHLSQPGAWQECDLASPMLSLRLPELQSDPANYMKLQPNAVVSPFEAVPSASAGIMLREDMSGLSHLCNLPQIIAGLQQRTAMLQLAQQHQLPPFDTHLGHMLTNLISHPCHMPKRHTPSDVCGLNQQMPRCFSPNLMEHSLRQPYKPPKGTASAVVSIPGPPYVEGGLSMGATDSLDLGPSLMATDPGAVSACVLASNLPVRMNKLTEAVQTKIVQLIQSCPTVVGMKDFDIRVVRKLNILTTTYGESECLALLDRLSVQLDSKQKVYMRNTAGYLDVAVGSHIETLRAAAKASGNLVTRRSSCPRQTGQQPAPGHQVIHGKIPEDKLSQMCLSAFSQSALPSGCGNSTMPVRMHL